MTEKSQTAGKPNSQTFVWLQGRFLAFWLFGFLAVLPACSSPPRNLDAVHAYYNYEFTEAREELRGDANLKNDGQVVLNNVRLGMAALADGDSSEAERALGRSFEFLSTAGLNKDRTVTAVLDHEGVRIWKGEPFEQALTYYYVSALYSIMGDWENARAAAANSLFRLTDFGKDQDPEKLTRHAAKDPEYLKNGYTAVDTNFALGFLMEAIGSDLSSSGGAQEQFDAALKIDPELKPLVETLRNHDYDTLLLVDYGKGPTKIAYGPDDALVRFAPQDQPGGCLTVSAGGRQLANALPICDVNQMAIDHRWNNLDDIRRAKSAIGNFLLYGGLVTTSIGSHQRDDTVALAGLAAMGVGLLTKAGARADTRYCEFMPQSIYLVPLTLGTASDLRISMQADAKSLLILDNVQPGSPGKPRAMYLRFLGPGSPGPNWLTRRNAIYGNDATGVLAGAEGFPWILGGHDVSTPTREVLAAYQSNGFLRDMTINDLEDLYAAEGIHLGSGMENRPDVPRNPSFRHILEGGTGLFTPEPNSMGYKRLMCAPHRPYHAKSELVRNAAEAIRVQLQADTQPTQEEIQQ